MIYPSKIDTWLVCLIAFVLLVDLACIIFLWLYLPTETTAFISTVVFLLAVVAAIVWIFSTTLYIVHDNELKIRSGPFSWRIPINTITQVKATHNPLSAPALSLDRLEISYGSARKICISPRDKTEFLQAIGQSLKGE